MPEGDAVLPANEIEGESWQRIGAVLEPWAGAVESGARLGEAHYRKWPPRPEGDGEGVAPKLELAHGEGGPVGPGERPPSGATPLPCRKRTSSSHRLNGWLGATSVTI